MKDCGLVRWAKLTVRKDGVVKPRVTLEVVGETTREGLLRVQRVAFEAPEGDNINIITSSGIQSVTLDNNAFRGLTPGMVQVMEAKFFRFTEEGKPEETDYANCAFAEARLRFDALIKLQSIEEGTRMAQKRAETGFVPVEPRKCIVKMHDKELPAIREFRALVRGGVLEVVPLGSFRASCDNLMRLS